MTYDDACARDVMVSSRAMLARLSLEEAQLKKLGLHGNAAGVRTAITILIRQVQSAGELPTSLEPEE